MLTFKEFEAAKLYVLLNCPEVDDYLNLYEELIGEDISQEILSIRIEKEFPDWLKKYIADNPDDPKAAKLSILSSTPFMEVNVYQGYFVGGYVFHTENYGETRSTWNSGVNLKGNVEFYGVLNEVIELRYLGGNSVVLFNCVWRDSNHGIRRHPTFDMIDVKFFSRHQGDDIFILASQVQQVYMTPYSYRHSSGNGWWAVWKVRERDMGKGGDPSKHLRSMSNYACHLCEGGGRKGALLNI